MKILVTGASGFIGRAFCHEAIQRGHQILALARDPAAKIAPEVQIAAGSLADTPWEQVAVFAPDAALHLAWIAEPGVYLNSPENEVWLEQSKIWFSRLIDFGVPYLIGTGTCIEYGPSSEPLDERTSPLAPQFAYSKAKVALYEWLSGLTGADWAWFRVFYPYGAGEHPNRYTSMMARQLREGRTLSMNTPQSVRDYIEIRDVVSAMCQAIETRATGALNIGTGCGVTIREIAQELARLLGVDANLVQDNTSAAPDPMPCILANATRLVQTGWKTRISLSEGLQRLIEGASAPN